MSEVLHSNRGRQIINKYIIYTKKEGKQGKGIGKGCVVLDLVVRENNSVEVREQAL